MIASSGIDDLRRPVREDDGVGKDRPEKGRFGEENGGTLLSRNAMDDRPWFLSFHASWCEPCRWLHPWLDRAEAEASDRWRVHRIDIDETPHLAEEFRIRSVPAVLLLQGGEVIERSFGFEPERLEAMMGRAGELRAS